MRRVSGRSNGIVSVDTIAVVWQRECKYNLANDDAGGNRKRRHQEDE
jgi:hypothetical protein